VYVLLSEATGSPSSSHRDETTDSPTDQSELVEELRRTNERLRGVITTRDEEIRRRDTIIMNMTEAMKALSPPARDVPPEPRESPETVEEASDRAEPRPAAGGAQEGARRPWWRRVLGR
jgi:hypothetical protein